MTLNESPPTYERLLFPAITVVAAVILWLKPDALPLDVQLMMLAALVIVFGLPHGALDPWVAERIGLTPTKPGVLGFNLIYLSIVAMVVLVWFWLPVCSLAIFLVISAWHFSGDWQSDLSLWSRLVAGSLLLLMPIGFHSQEVAVLFSHLSGPGGEQLAYALALPPWLLSLAIVGLVALSTWQGRWQAALEYLSLLALAYIAPPLVYFVLYFCALHSLRHMAGLFRQAPQSVRLRLWRMAIVYSLAMVALASILWRFWAHLPVDALVLKLVFIGLAAVTVPHMILIALAHQRGLQHD
jgi:beta-carotene 15,15'-dioxygenase